MGTPMKCVERTGSREYEENLAGGGSGRDKPEKVDLLPRVDLPAEAQSLYIVCVRRATQSISKHSYPTEIYLP